MLIHTRDLVKVYRMGDSEVRALDGINVDVARGEFVAVMGPSGSGKSTFMNVVGCLDRPTRGEYRLDGRAVSEMARDQLAAVRNRHIGFVFQQFNLLARASSRVLALLLAAVASVSLLVGGIGIMNIMLVSVTERTREIGLRMAVGARTRDILGQFLVEAVTLSLIGGLIGVALGMGAAAAIASFAGWRVLLSPEAVGLAVAFAFVIGVFFGFYPARKAARLNPVEALRFE
jgi:ABC-type ATPase involved in cell division